MGRRGAKTFLKKVAEEKALFFLLLLRGSPRSSHLKSPETSLIKGKGCVAGKCESAPQSADIFVFGEGGKRKCFF